MNLESYYYRHQNSIIIYKQLSTQDAICPLSGYHQQQPTVVESKPTSKLKRKLIKNAGSRQDMHRKNYQTVSQSKPVLVILKGNRKVEDQGTY